MHPLPRFVARLAAGALALSFAACASSKTPPPPRGLDRITQTGELRVGMTGEQPPLNMTARNGELIGMEVAIIRVLARSMGVEPRFVRLPFGQLLDALDAGDVDLVMSGMTITPERIQRAAFVGPYYTSGKCVLTKSERLAAAEVPEDLDSPGLRVAALAGSTSEAFVRRSLPRAEPVPSERLESAVQQVIDGGVDALVADRETCQFAALRHPDAGLRVSSTTFTIEPMGIAVSLDQARLANLLQTYLTSLEESGTLAKASRFWFQDPSWVHEIR
jgi:polar amino acid transport system substrate-binding protein